MSKQNQIDTLKAEIGSLQLNVKREREIREKQIEDFELKTRKVSGELYDRIELRVNNMIRDFENQVVTDILNDENRRKLRQFIIDVLQSLFTFEDE